MLKRKHVVPALYNSGVSRSLPIGIGHHVARIKAHAAFHSVGSVLHLQHLGLGLAGGTDRDGDVISPEPGVPGGKGNAPGRALRILGIPRRHPHHKTARPAVHKKRLHRIGEEPVPAELMIG